jgi:UDP-4-amino-4,6-dideoxy-N-acetyl-beta-L-altrosamine transaminase
MIPYGKQSIDDDDIAAVVDVLKSDWITTGPKIPEFEQALSRYVGCHHTVAVNSGTSALDIAVQSLHLPPGSEAVTTPFTFVATSNALLYNGVKPVFADIDRKTRNIDPESIRKKITKKTRAIVFVDFAGHPCDIQHIREIADDYDLFLIDDASHALGAEYHHTKIGNLADLTIFSFHPVKHVTTGEGGAITTQDPELYKKLCLYRSHGIDRDVQVRYGPDASWTYDMKELGRNYRMTDFQAALGISQLKKLDRFIEKRSALAEQYNKILKDLPWISLPSTAPDIRHAWHIYTILLDKKISRNAFFNYMRSANIGVNVHYIPVYRHSYYQRILPVRMEDYPVTEDVFDRIITIPLHPMITDNEFDYIIRTIESYPE